MRARRWFTTHTGYTNRHGYFACNGKFKRPANYSIVWETNRWDIRDGNVVQAYYNGPKIKGQWRLDIAGGKSLRYATIHRAAMRFYYGDVCGLARPVHTRTEKIAYKHTDGNSLGGYNRQGGVGVWRDIVIYGKNQGVWRDMSEIFSTASHELGHAAHYTNNRDNYSKSSEQLIESWARGVQYILTNKEYDELDVFFNLFQYDLFESVNEHNLPCGMKMMLPDMQYNFQKWDSKDRSEINRNYTPLFIDLMDNYNQREYYRLKYTNDPSVASAYPDDFIHDLPVSVLQQIVFESKTLADVKKKLHGFAAQFPLAEQYYNLTDETIDSLFELYE